MDLTALRGELFMGNFSHLRKTRVASRISMGYVGVIITSGLLSFIKKMQSFMKFNDNLLQNCYTLLVANRCYRLIDMLPVYMG